MSALVARPIGPDELDLFTSFADASPLGLRPPLAMYLAGLHNWYRPEWSWVALRDGQVVARIAFSGQRDAKLPFAMGSLEIGTRPDRVETGSASHSGSRPDGIGDDSSAGTGFHRGHEAVRTA